MAVLPASSVASVAKISTHIDNITGDDQAPQIAVDATGNSYVVREGFDGTDSQIYWVTIDTTSTPGTVTKISTHEDM